MIPAWLHVLMLNAGVAIAVTAGLAWHALILSVCRGAIDSPRMFKQEGLPRGPIWTDVQRLIDSTSDRALRDRAIGLCG